VSLRRTDTQFPKPLTASGHLRDRLDLFHVKQIPVVSQESLCQCEPQPDVMNILALLDTVWFPETGCG